MTASLLSLAFASLLLTACAFDLKAFRIPNAIPLALVALFLLRAALAADGAAWPSHLAAFGIMFSLGFLAFALGLFGGGDAKLMAAVALWIGLASLPSFLTITAIAGGVLGVTLLACRFAAHRRLVAAPEAPLSRPPKLFDRGASLPYAVPITIAALLLEWR